MERSAGLCWMDHWWNQPWTSQSGGHFPPIETWGRKTADLYAPEQNVSFCAWSSLHLWFEEVNSWWFLPQVRPFSAAAEGDPQSCAGTWLCFEGFCLSKCKRLFFPAGAEHCPVRTKGWLCWAAVQPRNEVKSTGMAAKTASRGMCPVAKPRLPKDVIPAGRGNELEIKSLHLGISVGWNSWSQTIWACLGFSGLLNPRKIWSVNELSMFLAQFAGESQCWCFPGEGKEFFILLCWKEPWHLRVGAGPLG